MRVNKYQSAPNKVNKNLISIDLSTLNILCRYIISNSNFLRLSNISILSNMMYSIDPKSYQNDQDKINRIEFIKAGIDARLKYNLNDSELIKNHILTNINFNPDFIDFNDSLSQDEISWVNHDIIENSSKYGFIYGYSDKFIDLCTKLKTTSYEHRGEVVQEFEHLIDQTKNEFRKVATTDSLTDLQFSLKPGSFESAISDIYKVVTSPSRRIKCGMQGLNEMTGGGFESTRVYMFLGITGAGKSMTLLNIAYQMKRYNPFYRLKDPTRTPCIVYLTMENSVVETVTRLFSMVTETQQSMDHFSLQEVIAKLKQEGQLVLNDQSPIDLVIRYKPNRSVDTSYLYTLYDDLYDVGYEPICFIQDHLLRIRSVESQSSEPRFELGNIVNEFKVFATEKDIPFLSNFHLNREAMKEVESYGKKFTHVDVTQKLGKSNISESVMILNNSDCAIIINKDYDEYQNQYMAFNLIKMRDQTDIRYFAQPYMYGNPIRLVEDASGPAMFKTTIHGNIEIQQQENVKTSSANALANYNPVSLEDPVQTIMSPSTFSNDNKFYYQDEDGLLDDHNEEAPADEFPDIKKQVPKRNPIIIYNEALYNKMVNHIDNHADDKLSIDIGGIRDLLANK